MKRKLAKVLIGVLMVHNIYSTEIDGITMEADKTIASERITRVNVGQEDAVQLRQTINFTDVADRYWANEPITRMASLDLVRGYSAPNGTVVFRPVNEVSKEEALTFIIRAIGREADAKRAAEEVTPLAGDTTTNIWSKGYLTLAQQIGLIEQQDLTDALRYDQNLLDPAVSFRREDPATREEVAKWIVDAINSKTPETIPPIYASDQYVRDYDDWNDIGLSYIPYVEAMTKAKYMQGYGTEFRPKEGIKRAELMQVFKNLDAILYDALGFAVKKGYIGQMDTADKIIDGIMTKEQRMRVRLEDGTVEELVFREVVTADDKEIKNDAVVYKNNKRTSLKEIVLGEEVEFLTAKVADEDGSYKLHYVHATGIKPVETVMGVLQPFTDFENGVITIKQNEVAKSYTMVDGIYGTDATTKEQFIVINNKKIKANEAPITNNVELTLKNNVVTNINYGSDISSEQQIAGLVKSHDKNFNFIVITGWDGKEYVKQYNPKTIVVEKENYYDTEDTIGYIDEMFPNYKFDKSDVDIKDIEEGDIVTVRMNPENEKEILSLRAKTNYVVAFGEILSSIYKGSAGTDIIVKLGDGSVKSFHLPSSIPIIKDNQNIGPTLIEAGDVARFLINQVVTNPGTIKEHVKEVIIDKNGNEVNAIYKGTLGKLDKAQETLSLFDTFELKQTGWANYKNSMLIDIADTDIEYYYGNKRITIEYANKFLRQPNMITYIATSKYFNTEKIAKVTFRDSRDSVLDYTNVTVTNGVNQIDLLTHSGTITVDDGTIVVKNGKMVSLANLVAPDYTQVVLNGKDYAAVVQVRPEPNNDAISIFRGRIAKINDFEDFTVQSNAGLYGMEWIYSPIKRVYQMNAKTIIKEDTGIVSINDFIGYGDNSKIDNVYTIIAEGPEAKVISKSPYSKEGVQGTVYKIQGTDLSLKGTLVYDGTKKSWQQLSTTDSSSVIETVNMSIIIKNNKIVTIDDIEIGDKLRVMTNVNLVDTLKKSNIRKATGYIVLVE